MQIGKRSHGILPMPTHHYLVGRWFHFPLLVLFVIYSSVAVDSSLFFFPFPLPRLSHPSHCTVTPDSFSLCVWRCLRLSFP